MSEVVMNEEVLLYEKVGKVGKVILNRPKVRNALNHALSSNLGDFMRKADAEASASMSKLTGGLNLGGLF